MEIYYAPMEGITGYIQRNAAHQNFRGVSKYFTAFLAANEKGCFSTKEKNDFSPDNNKGIYLVPQLITNDTEDFHITVEKLKEYGYREVNYNLGCPSRTVVTKFRGSGFLAKPDELDRFLDTLYHENDVEISIKTRIGMAELSEWEQILEIYNQYPLKELIIHPRLQSDYYKNRPHLEAFEYAIHNSKCPICYNGDIFNLQDLLYIKERFPAVDKLMLGRGLLMNPGLAEMLTTREMPAKDRIRIYHDQIYEHYKVVSYGDHNVLFKMKELWTYMICIFEDSKKYAKKIKKAEKLWAYDQAVEELFEKCDLTMNYTLKLK